MLGGRALSKAVPLNVVVCFVTLGAGACSLSGPKEGGYHTLLQQVYYK